jgi:CRP-like cAMP-binding protein
MKRLERHLPMQPQIHRRPENFRALLESSETPFEIAEYPPRAPIFLQGDPCDTVMHIETGRVWLAVTAPSGKEAICDLLDTGAFLGEEALAGVAERRHSASAVTHTQVLAVPKEEMVRLLYTQRRAMSRFSSHLLARNIRLEAGLADQLLYTSEERLAHTLLWLAHCDDRGHCKCPLPRLSQAVIAEMVGTTRSRVNSFMNKFKKLGFIEECRGVIHINPNRLPDRPDREKESF